MPLQGGGSKEARSANIAELNSSKPSSARNKGIKTLAEREGISYEEAKKKMSMAIAYSKWRKDKKKKK